MPGMVMFIPAIVADGSPVGFGSGPGSSCEKTKSNWSLRMLAFSLLPLKSLPSDLSEAMPEESCF